MKLEEIKQNPGGLFFLKGTLLWLDPGTGSTRKNIPVDDTQGSGPRLIVILDAVKFTGIIHNHDAVTYINDDTYVLSTNSYSDDSYDLDEPNDPYDRPITMTALIGSGVYRIYTCESYVESAEDIA